MRSFSKSRLCFDILNVFLLLCCPRQNQMTSTIAHITVSFSPNYWLVFLGSKYIAKKLERFLTHILLPNTNYTTATLFSLLSLLPCDSDETGYKKSVYEKYDNKKCQNCLNSCSQIFFLRAARVLNPKLYHLYYKS